MSEIERLLGRWWMPVEGKNGSACPPEGMNAFQLIEYFLKLHEYWFEMDGNSLYGKRSLAAAFLLERLATGYWPVLSMDAQYVINKFECEYCPLFKEVSRGQEDVRCQSFKSLS